MRVSFIIVLVYVLASCMSNVEIDSNIDVSDERLVISFKDSKKIQNKVKYLLGSSVDSDGNCANIKPVELIGETSTNAINLPLNHHYEVVFLSDVHSCMVFVRGLEDGRRVADIIDVFSGHLNIWANRVCFDSSQSYSKLTGRREKAVF